MYLWASTAVGKHPMDLVAFHNAIQHLATTPVRKVQAVAGRPAHFAALHEGRRAAAARVHAALDAASLQGGLPGWDVDALAPRSLDAAPHRDVGHADALALHEDQRALPARCLDDDGLLGTEAKDRATPDKAYCLWVDARPYEHQAPATAAACASVDSGRDTGLVVRHKHRARLCGIPREGPAPFRWNHGAEEDQRRNKAKDSGNKLPQGRAGRSTARCALRRRRQVRPAGAESLGGAPLVRQGSLAVSA
mmetsp:Transcript_101815/g.296868  ORF Transcript_101815/g.296868 Transcript_101815/m.296868 type:complete len:250 (-) Transcript_101815:925-1674(-)